MKQVKKRANSLLKTFELVKVVDLERIIPQNPDIPSFVFRIEILKERKVRGQFHARVYRKETLRVQPTFPQEDSRPKYECSDEDIFVEDIVKDWEDFRGKTAEVVLNKVLNKIRETFKIK